jgi:hypothetical protein
MAKTAAEIGQILADAKNEIRKEWARLATLQKKLEGKLVRTWTPDNADLEYRDLLRKASAPWLIFARDCIAQGVIIDGYTDSAVWARAWQDNGMDGRQHAITKEAIGLGKSFIMHLPADNGRVVMRGISALSTYAVYKDPWDEYPVWALTRIGKRKANFWDSDWYFFDDEGAYRFTGDVTTPQDVEFTAHDLGETPVVMISNTLAMEGEPLSSVEPAITTYERIVDATFTLEMVQRYGAFPQKWMAGGEIAKDENGNPLVRSSVDGLLHASGTSGESARFGSFASASLSDVVTALDAHIKHLAAVCQVPPHYLLGAVINMSAEGIAAAESGYFRNIGERQSSLGEGYELSLRTAAALLGETAAAEDTSSQVHFADVSTRSLAQISDAIVKLAAVGAPLELLFAMIPGWSKTDVMDAAQQALAARPEPLAIEQ